MYLGIRRRLDDLGRLVIPMELRKMYGIKNNDELEILATEKGILIKVPKFNIKIEPANEETRKY